MVNSVGKWNYENTIQELVKSAARYVWISYIIYNDHDSLWNGLKTSDFTIVGKRLIFSTLKVM